MGKYFYQKRGACMKTINLDLDSNHPDTKNIISLLAGYDSAMKLYSGDYTAPWLLSDIHDIKWYMKTTKTIKVRGGKEEYKYTQTILWGRLLPNGTKLTDDCNQDFLHFIQKLFFLICENGEQGNRAAVSKILAESSAFFQFISWIFLYESIFEPLKYGLSKLTQSALEQYSKDFIQLGAFGALRVPQRIISQIGIEVEVVSEKDYLSLGRNDIEKITEYFKNGDFYIENRRGLKHINRLQICQCFNIAKQEMQAPAANAFFRQFEPDFLSLSNEVLIPISQVSKYPSHRTPLIKDVVGKTYTKAASRTGISIVANAMKFSRLFDGKLPMAETIKFGKLNSINNRNSAPNEKTPWMPLETSLKLINKSIGLIVNDSDAIIDFYEEIMTKFRDLKILDRDNRRKLGISKGDMLVKLLPNQLKKFEITHFNPHEVSYMDDDREVKNTFFDIVELLVASCTCLIAALKPIRIEELINLQYDCLYFKEGDGYWLEQSLMKSGINDILPETAKPIPAIAARAIQCLRRLNEITKKLSKTVNKKESNYLFYQFFGQSNYQGCIISKEKIGMILEKLCDHAETTVDEYGRRWYVNIHELRKSFLLTFFWTYKESSLDACQWIAGHRNVEHVHQYIHSTYAGEEMTGIEAEYARQQMYLFNKSSSMLEMNNTEELYNDVCKHFKVKNVSEVDEDELSEWIELCLIKDIYSIEVIGLEASNSLFEECTVAFKLRKRGAYAE